MDEGCSCSIKDLRLNYPIPRHFADPQWPANITTSGRIVFGAYRSIVSIFLLAFTLRSLLNKQSYFFIYLTEWAFTFLTFYFVVSAISSIIHTKRRLRNVELSPDVLLMWFTRFHWGLFNLAASPALTVTIIFWALYSKNAVELDLDSVIQHAFNSALLLLELIVSATPVRALHFIYPMIFGIIYLLFTVIYWGAGGKNPEGESYIYSDLDYDKAPEKAVQWFFIIIIIAGVLHVAVIWGIYRLRILIFAQVFNQEPELLEMKRRNVSINSV